MKVLFLNYEYPPLGGGAGNATEYLLREYAGMPDLEVHLVTASIDGAAHRETIGGQVTVHRVPIGKDAAHLHFQSVVDLLRYTWSGYRYARRLMADEGGFDVIHAFFTVPCGAQAYLLGRRFHLPYIVSLRGADVPGFSGRFGIFYSVLKPLIRFIWRQAARVVAASAGLRELARQTAGRQAIEVIPNGIAVQEYRIAPGSGDGVFRLVSSSRLTPRKGLRYVIEALSLLKAAGRTGVEAILIGDGHEKESLERFARTRGVADQVRFTGRIPHPELAEWYARADAFVLPSFNEGMSNAMLEAAAAGLPLLVTDTGGTAEVLREGENGFVIGKGSASDIANRTERLIAYPELRQKMSAGSRARAEELSWHNVARAYGKLYQAVTKR